MARLLAELDRLAAGEDPWAQERLRARTRLHAHQDAHSTERLLDAVGL